MNNNNANGSTPWDSQSKFVALLRAQIVTSDNNAGDDSGADLVLYRKHEAEAGTESVRFKSTGDVLPGANGSQDLGSSSKRWQDVYTSDLDLSNEAKGGNTIDGTWGSYKIEEGENDLFLINRRNNKRYKFNLTEVD